MEHHKIFLNGPNNQNKYYIIPYSSNYGINQRLKKVKYINKNPITNYSLFNTSRIKTNSAIYSTFKDISYRKFYNRVKIHKYQTKDFKNELYSENLLNKRIEYNSSSSIENDLDIMKIRMSCDLITHKINQIKNRVQEMHDSSLKDNKVLLDTNNTFDSKETNNEVYYNNYTNISSISNNMNSFEDCRASKDPYFDIIPKSMKISKKRRKDNIKSNINTINNTFNSYINNNSKCINNFRKYSDINIIKTKDNKKFNCNRNALKHMILNIANKQNTSLPTKNRNIYFDSNNSSLYIQKEKSFNEENNDFNFNNFNDNNFSSYSKKVNDLLKHNNTQNTIFKEKINLKNKVLNIKEGCRRKNEQMNDFDVKLLEENNKYSQEIRYGSFDKYFINNNNSIQSKYINKNVNDKTNINKYSHKTFNKYSLKRNKLIDNNIKEKNRLSKNLGINNLINNNIHNKKGNITYNDDLKHNKILKFNINNKNFFSKKLNTKNNIIVKNKNNEFSGKDSAMINNFQNSLKKENNILNHNINNDLINNKGKGEFLNNKIRRKNGNIINNISIKDNDFKININNISNYSINNNCLNINKSNLNENSYNKYENIHFQKNNFNINDMDDNIDSTIYNHIYEEKRNINKYFHSDYSKDDILRNSEIFINKEENENKNINSLKYTRNIIFDSIIRKEKGKNKTGYKKMKKLKTMIKMNKPKIKKRIMKNERNFNSNKNDNNTYKFGKNENLINAVNEESKIEIKK